MCTLANKNEISVAKRPIKCYKILYAIGEIRRTPLQMASISWRCFERAEPFCANRDSVLIKTPFLRENFGDYIVKASSGFIHCFQNQDEAEKAAAAYFKTPFEEEKTEVWEVMVPAGAKYVKGINQWTNEGSHRLDKLPTIAANKIVFKKCVATYYNIKK